MIETSLQFTLKNAAEEKQTITLKNPKPNLTNQEVTNAIRTIVDSGVLTIKGSPVASVSSVKLIERTITEFAA
jgi:hypothetical protein